MDFTVTPTPMNYSDDSSCLPQQGNKTVFIYEGYGGVPETLAINAIVWVLLIILFAILRRVAWDYGRIALVSRHEENVQVNADGRPENKYNVWTSLFYGEQDSNKQGGSIESLDTQLHQQDRGFCSWIVAFLRVKDVDIVKKCGLDALQYITFQRYLLLYLTIVCVLSTTIIIPVNFTGDNIGNATDFGHTTIANLNSESQLLWIHAILSVVYMILAAIFMRHFSINLKCVDDEQVSKTLMISHIPKDKCYKNILTQHFTEGYPEIVVEDIQFAYDVEKLMELEKHRSTAAESRMNSELELQKTGHRPTIRPYKCGQCLCCGDACGCVERDAITYYGDEETRLKAECDAEKAKAYQKSLGVGFVTFETISMAERIYTDFQPSCKAAPNPAPSTVHSELDIVEWNIAYAPAPENIYWAKLALSGWKWWARAIIINFLVLLLLFFLTTPTIVLTNLDKLNYKDYISKAPYSVFLLHFLPTLLLWTFTALLPNIVWYSDQYVGHWTRSAEHHAMMQKIFIFLVLMVLILPSLGLTSAKALFDIFIVEHGKNVKWSCIFLSGNGAFFVNYVITSAFIGTALELLRFSELFTYGMKLLFAKSSAERTSVRKHVLWEFQYGMEYAWVLCVFALVMSYSISCPLITPFGLVYMVMKHIVDRYNLYFAYKPSHISPGIHSTAISFVLIAVVFLQFNFVFFTMIRGGYEEPLTIFSLVVLILTLMMFFTRVCFGWFKNIGPLSRQNKYTQFSDQNGCPRIEEENQRFVAGVLTRSGSGGASETSTNRQPVGLSATDSLAHSYGATESRDVQPEPAFTE